MGLALKSTATTVLRGEQALVQAARRGDDRAFEQLYEQYRDRITMFIHGRIRDHGRAEDISQEVFMAALRQLRSSDQPVVFKPWIFAIAKNACIDEFRRSARGREVGVETDSDFPTDQRASLSIVPSPPAAIESKQRLDDLRAAFGGLSENHHRLIVMRELEGRSYDEIGTRLGMTRQMVESGLFRARRKLSEEYDDLASGRRCEQVQAVVDSGAAFKLKQLGIKERRRLTQHLSQCQACRQHARLAGIDETLLRPRSIAGRIAALVPIGGLWHWPWRSGGSGSLKAHAASGKLVASGAAQAAGTAGSSITLGQAAAAVAALAIAGAGGAVAVADHADHGHRATAVHQLTTSGARRAGMTGASATSSTQSIAGSSGAAAAGSRSHASGARPGASGSVTGRGASATAPKAPGTKSSLPGGSSTTGGSGPATPNTGASTPSSSGAPSPNINPTTKTPGQTLGKVTAPGSINKATNPATTPVKKVLSSPPVQTVTAPVQKVLSSPPVQSVTNPVTAPVKNVVSSPPVKSITGPVSTATNPVTSAPPVKQVGSTVGGVVKTTLPPTPTTPTTP